jgi:hypothetical protein
VLAYLSWHRAAPEVESGAYERALERFHRSLAHRPPSGFRGSATFRVRALPWLAPDGRGRAAAQAGYEDWYLIDDWAAVGVLEEAAVSRGHLTAHHRVASLAGVSTSSVYRLIEGHAHLGGGGIAVWVARPPGHENPSLAALLGDGMDRDSGALWRRCMGLGPAPEFCLLAAEAPPGVAPSRLPPGWTATPLARELLWAG